MLKIVQTPNTVLTTPAKRVVKIDAKIFKLVQEMEVTLNACVDPQGVGLAAPQVGVSLAIFLMKPDAKGPCEAYINPKIIERVEKKPTTTKKKQASAPLEGCLSIPKMWSPVVRSEKVLLEYMTLDGEVHKDWFSKFEAVIVQHEVDHLLGVLFTQRAIEQGSTLYEEKNGELYIAEI